MFMPRLSSRRSRVSFQYVSSNTTRFDSCTTEAEALSILVLATTTFLGTGALLPETQRIMPWRRASKDRSSLSTDKRRVAHQSHIMSIEKRPNQCKYWSLPPVVMSDHSLIATRNSHAKHNKSVGHIPERGQTRLLSFRVIKSGN